MRYETLTDKTLIKHYNNIVLELERRDLMAEDVEGDGNHPTIEQWIRTNWEVDYRQLSIERMAETLDKFEEDVLGHKTARIRGARRATVTFGEPIPIEPHKGSKQAAALTRVMEARVQALLDEE